MYKKVFGENTHSFINYKFKKILLMVSFLCLLVCCVIKTYLSFKKLKGADIWLEGGAVFFWIMFVGQWLCLPGVGLAVFLDKSAKYVEDDLALGGHQNAGDNNVESNVGGNATNARIPSVFESSNLPLPTAPPPVYASSSTNFGPGTIDMGKYGSVFEWDKSVSGK